MATEVTSFYPDTLDRMVRAVEQVKQRLQRIATALETAGIPYAIAGGNAVGAWVTQRGGTVRTTFDVDVAIRRDDLPRVISTLESAGFTYENVWDVGCFLDGPDAKPSEGVRILYAGEKVRPTDLEPFPGIDDVAHIATATYLSLHALVIAKLTSFRRKDQTHIDDLVRCGLIDQTWIARLPHALAIRLQTLLDSPE